MKNHRPFPSYFFSGFQLVSAMFSHHFFRFPRVRGVSVGQARRPVNFYEELSVFLHRLNMPTTNSYKIVLALITAAPLNLSLTAQTERFSLPRIV